MDDDKIIMIPLIAKETSDERHFRVMRGLIIALIVSNLAWMTTWGVYQVCHAVADNVASEVQVDSDSQ